MKVIAHHEIIFSSETKLRSASKLTRVSFAVTCLSEEG